MGKWKREKGMNVLLARDRFRRKFNGLQFSGVLLETGLGVSSMSYSLVGTLSETDSEIVAINFVARGGIFIVVSLPNVQRCICRGVSISFVRISQPTLKDWKWL